MSLLLERIFYILWTNSIGLGVLTVVVLLLQRFAGLGVGTLHLLWLSILTGYLAPFFAPGVRSVYVWQVDGAYEPSVAQLTWPFAAAVWAPGALAGVLAIIMRERRIRRHLRHAQLPPQDLVDAVSACAKELGMGRVPNVVAPLGCSTPMVVGTFSPRIVVPLTQWARLDRDGRRTMILHELAHVLRRDPLWTALAALTSALYWWNPLVWLALRRLRSAAELCCDDAVVRACPSARGAYARLLLDTAAIAVKGARTALSVNLSSAGHQLAARLKRILESTPAPPPSMASVIGVALFLLVGALNVPGVKGLRYRVVVLEAAPGDAAVPDHEDR